MNAIWRSRIFQALGICLVTYVIYLAALSHAFEYGSPMEGRPIRAAVALMMGAGIIFLAAAWFAQRLPNTPKLLAYVFLIGLGMRLVLFASTPILEDDYYRYLWDGGVTAHGYNPYAYIPFDVEIGRGEIPGGLTELGKESDLVLKRINHATLGTVYPPITQIAFAAAHVLGPWSLTAWRCVLLAFELATFGLLLRLARGFRVSEANIAVYWWNPLVVKEIFNSAHMDAVLIPFLLAALLFSVNHSTFRAGFSLALAVGAKLWPVILIPLLVRQLRLPRMRLVATVLLGAVVLGLLFIPMLAARSHGSDSGFAAYTDRWEMNDLFFMLLAQGTESTLDLFDAGTSERISFWTRGVVALMVLSVALLISKRSIEGPYDFANRVVWVVAALFLLSPAQFPWYFLWIAPFLVLIPRPSLLVLTVMLPVYYLKFYFTAQGRAEYFHTSIVWIEYAPTAILLIWEILIRWRPAFMQKGV